MRLFGRKSNSETQASATSENANDYSQPQAAHGPSDPISSARVQNTPAKTAPSSRISTAKLEKSKRELKTLLFEKELVSGALTRLYEAEANGEITKEERETLAVKYREQLRNLNSEIIKIDAFIEVGDLEVLRDQLIELVRQKVEAIEKRIEKTRPLAQALIGEDAPVSVLQKVKPPEPPVTKPRVPNISNMLESKVAEPEIASDEKTANQEAPVPTVTSVGAPTETDVSSQLRPRKKTESPVEPDEVDQLQQELRDALDRLEKLDLES